MGLFSFAKDAGQSIFGKGYANKEKDNQERAQALTKVITDLGFKVEGLFVDYSDHTATIAGVAQSREDKEKIVLAVGNVKGVEKVNDLLRVAPSKQEAPPASVPEAPAEAASLPAAEDAGPTSTFYTVQPGDTLSKIAKAHYGNANKYMVIFQANTPMLAHPDKIYPGQVLRIPPLS